eukprot:gnl/Carplike_NY0171/5961_a8167_267.p1 GENE.gnl/Carplike_NY0171/5961_a8167_267~~gnl/Carplike_NY0171/5961_a8167_267.p1  ORF type:complete len:226 (-),score=30.06 gnl/Carplike_NY0171/5961_a8167_267:107-784(-)
MDRAHIDHLYETLLPELKFSKHTVAARLSGISDSKLDLQDLAYYFINCILDESSGKLKVVVPLKVLPCTTRPGEGDPIVEVTSSGSISTINTSNIRTALYALRSVAAVVRSVPKFEKVQITNFKTTNSSSTLQLPFDVNVAAFYEAVTSERMKAKLISASGGEFPTIDDKENQSVHMKAFGVLPGRSFPAFDVGKRYIKMMGRGGPGGHKMLLKILFPIVCQCKF